MGKNRTVKEVKGLAKEENGVTKVYIGGVWVKGGKDEEGIYYLTKCQKCGAPVKQYLGKRGPKRLYCNNCKASLGIKVDGNRIVTKRGVLELVEE